ncbi:MAG: radical SAM protein, partial [Victivallales bacterium]|nr:radical SAM protein [Victivallales bacterium]
MSMTKGKAAVGKGFLHLFGPVPSRRLGRSLGIDLIPHKTCSMNCVYCESGATTNLTAERAEFHPLEQITSELDRYLDAKPRLDYITFSGAGEPTLYSRIGEIISCLKKKYPQYRTALLTNSTMLVREEVAEAVKDVDLIVPSLDAATPGIFKRINRPAESADCREIIQALVDFRKISRAEFWLEIFIVPGLNDSTYSL